MKINICNSPVLYLLYLRISIMILFVVKKGPIRKGDGSSQGDILEINKLIQNAENNIEYPYINYHVFSVKPY